MYCQFQFTRRRLKDLFGSLCSKDSQWGEIYQNERRTRHTADISNIAGISEVHLQSRRSAAFRFNPRTRTTLSRAESTVELTPDCKSNHSELVVVDARASPKSNELYRSFKLPSPDLNPSVRSVLRPVFWNLFVACPPIMLGIAMWLTTSLPLALTLIASLALGLLLLYVSYLVASRFNVNGSEILWSSSSLGDREVILRPQAIHFTSSVGIRKSRPRRVSVFFYSGHPRVLSAFCMDSMKIVQLSSVVTNLKRLRVPTRGPALSCSTDGTNK